MIVLAYHRVSDRTETSFSDKVMYRAENFYRDILWLKSNFDLVTLEHVSRYREYDEGCIAITVDDGYRDSFLLTSDICEAESVPLTHFVPSRVLRGMVLPWDHLSYLVKCTEHHESRGTVLGLRSIKTIEEKLNFIKDLKRHLKTYSEQKILKCIADLSIELEVSLREDRHSNLYVSHDDLCSVLSKNTLIDIGSHTTSHAILSRQSDEVANEQIFLSKVELEKTLGRKIRYFAFPNGQHQDFHSRHIEMLKSAGYTAAFSAEPRIHPTTECLFSFPRLCVNAHEELPVLLEDLRW